MLEALILWNLVRVRDDLNYDGEDSHDWLIIPLFIVSSLLWPIGLSITARKYFELSWRRSIVSTAVITGLVLLLVPMAYFVISLVMFVVGVWYFGNEER